MLTPEVVETLLAPLSEALPCGDDLEYDPAFIALSAAALTWLAGMTHYLAAHPAGPGLPDNLHAAGQRPVHVFDRPPERVYVVTCRSNGCTEASYADPDPAAPVMFRVGS